MGYIDSGKKEGATVHYGGNRCGNDGYFINPTIFTDSKPDMKIVKEEIFGPVGVVIKFDDEEGVSYYFTSSLILLSHLDPFTQMPSSKPTTPVCCSSIPLSTDIHRAADSVWPRRRRL